MNQPLRLCIPCVAVVFFLPLSAGAETLIKETFEQANSSRLEEYGLLGLSGTYSKSYVTTGTGANGWKTQLVPKPPDGDGTVVRAYGSTTSEATNFGYWFNFSKLRKMCVSVDIQTGDASYGALIFGAANPVGSGMAGAGFFVRILYNGTVVVFLSGGAGPQYTFAGKANTGWNTNTVQIDYTLTDAAPYTATFNVRVNGELLAGPGAGGSFVRTGLSATGNFVRENYIWFQTAYPGSGIKSATYDNIAVTDGGPVVSIGAIRWDGYTGASDAVGLGVINALGPAKYHFRLPFYGRITGQDSVDIPAPTLSTIEEEIRYAYTGGIDYWAFDWYPAGFHNMDAARNLYLSSPLSCYVKWCVILGTAGFSLTNDLPWLVAEMKRDRYQKVIGGRPLIYYLGAKLEVAGTIAAIRSACSQAGLANPYVVGTAWSADQAAINRIDSGCDAMTQYAAGGSSGAHFQDYAAGQKASWGSYLNTGMQVVPWVATGWDTRPYFDNPSPFYTETDGTRWVQQGTPQEIAAFLKEAMDWNKAHPETDIANTVLIYGWNENTEGGWINPTLFEIRDSGRPQRLDAIRDTLVNVRGPWAPIPVKVP